MFSEQEIEYLKSQTLARIATVSEQLQPDVAPVLFEFDGERFYVTGLDLTKTLKYKNIVDGNRKAAIVVDDLESLEPLKPRGIKVHGTAEIVEREGKFGFRSYVRISPEKYWSWGVERPAFENGQVVMKKISKQSQSDDKSST